ncbi:F510_1955 family glycosylhydrolase [Mycobacterium sp. NPDC050041]|uniref:F510_1955 family glycosylhydrolase n=1 Tax=Mycobacterium sp. NPDC050041 TaxID=3364293 RepID=UPI003C2C8B31
MNAAAALVVAFSGPVEDTPAVVPGMTHIHGLGINPSDQRLYVATHYGLFRITEDDAPQRVGDSMQDFMGFTVTGADEFLASGYPHPADRQQPPHPGLIRTTDAGQSWQSVSLKGSADFHALEYRHGRMYGLDSQSGAVMVSDDSRSWQTRTDVTAADLTVSPANAQEVVATARGGLLRSTGGASTFSTVSGAPQLILVSWPDSGHLIGADAGAGFTPAPTAARPGSRGPPSRPQALLAAGGGHMYVATDDAMYASDDDGASARILTSVS